jgi:hypothetical protein
MASLRWRPVAGLAYRNVQIFVPLGVILSTRFLAPLMRNSAIRPGTLAFAFLTSRSVANTRREALGICPHGQSLGKSRL